MRLCTLALALLVAAPACSSIEGPHQVDRIDAGTAGHPDATVPDSRPDIKADARPDAGGGGGDVDAAASKLDAGTGSDAGSVVVGIETIAPAMVTSGQKLEIRCELRDGNGGVAPWPATLVATIQIGDPAVVEAKSGVYTARKAGTTMATCSAGGFTDASPATIKVVPSAPTTVTTMVSRTPVLADPADAGTDVSCVLKDAAGNVVTDQTNVAIQLANPAAGMIVGKNIHFKLAGTQTVSCILSGATTTPAKVDVKPGRPATIKLVVAPAQETYKPGVTLTAQVAVFDSYDNVADASGVALSSSPPASAKPDALEVRYDAVGSYELTASIATGTATGEPISDSVEILVNDGAPTIECTPQMIVIDGSTNSWAATHVGGRAADANGVMSVTVNGGAVATDGNGNFAATVPSVFGVNAFDVVVTDGQGVARERWCSYIAAEKYQPEGTPPAGSVVLALGQGAIDDHMAGVLANSLGDVVDRALTPEQLGDILDSYLNVGNRYLASGCDPILGWVCASVYYEPTEQKTAVDTGNIDLGLGSAGIHTFLEATNFRLGLRIESGLLTIYGVASAQSASVDADFSIAAVGGLLDGTYVPNSLHTDFSDLNIDADNAIDQIIVNIVMKLFPSVITGVLNQVINNLMAKIVDDLLHAIRVDTFGITVVLPKLDGSGDVTVAAAGSFAQANANATRLYGSIAPVFNVTNGTKNGKASLGIAVQGGTITPPSVPLGGRSIALGLHAEAVNDLVHKLWRYSFFDGKLDPAALAEFGVDLGDLQTLFESLDVSMDMPLPPVVEIRPDGRVRFGVAGLRTILTIPGLTTPLEIEATGLFEGDGSLMNGRITITNIDTLSLHIATLALPDGIDSTNIAQFDMLATKLVEKILGEVLARSLLGIPVPELHLPTQIGPLTLPAPMTLGLDNPALTVTSPNLLIQSELLERP
jgi:hypothetical protein